MTAIRKRFKHFLTEKRLTQIEFSRLTGYNKKNISGFLTGNVQTPKMDFVVILAEHFPELNLRWLLTGEGRMFLSINNIPDNIEQEYWKLLKENSELKSKLITFLEQPTEV